MNYSFSLTQDLKRNPYPGRYIAFEGIDGCGKPTQVERVKKLLEEEGHTIVTTSEPMATGKIQELIRGALASEIKIPQKAFQSIYSADRGINHATIVEPALKRGDTVLSHRSIWSTIAYGILDLGEEYSFSKKAWPIAVAQGNFSAYYQFLAPDITFYLKITARDAMERLTPMRKKKDLYEKGEKLAKIVYGYDTLVAKFPQQIVVIDGEQDEDSITSQIIKKLQDEK